MAQLFDQVAGKFAGDIDQAISSGSYVRGTLFVELARNAIAKGSYVLDYGCGPGRLSKLMEQLGLRVRGVDTSPGMIEQARMLIGPGSTLEFGAIDKAIEALPRNTYDAIVCSSVIEYVPDADELLQQFRASLRPGGTLVISFANATSYFRKQWQRQSGDNPMGPGQHHVWHWPEFERLLRTNGFEPTTQPLYYESPWDGRFWGPWFRKSAHVGSLGVLVAKARPSS